MGKVLAGWGGIHRTTDAGLKPPEPEAATATPDAARDPLANWPADRVYYGLLRVYISSDEPGPVVVQIKDGALDGARLIGGFKRADEKVVIRFDRMTFRGAWYAVDAVAIDPENGRLGLATEVDRRTFTRWAALLGSAILQGAQRAYLSQGTQSSYLWGQTTTRDFDDREILGIALGEIGTRTRQRGHPVFQPARRPCTSIRRSSSWACCFWDRPAARPRATARRWPRAARRRPNRRARRPGRSRPTRARAPATAPARRCRRWPRRRRWPRPLPIPIPIPIPSERRWTTSPAWRPSPP
ncbi:MAG: DotG/IcmE/VirB10 family protein [Ottowia sp.]